MNFTRIARWEAKGGKRWIELRHYPEFGEHGYSYTGEGCGGGLPACSSHEDAIRTMENPWGSGYVGQVTVLKSDFPSVKRIW